MTELIVFGQANVLRAVKLPVNTDYCPMLMFHCYNLLLSILMFVDKLHPIFPLLMA